MRKIIAWLFVLSLLLQPVVVTGAEKKHFYQNYLVNNGGLNTKASNFALEDNETPDCQNVYFGTDGGIRKRLGQDDLYVTGIDGTPMVTGVYQYTQADADSFLIGTAGAFILKSDSLVTVDWDDITGGLTITPGALFDFETYENTVIATNGVDLPIKWEGTSDATTASVPTDLTKAKWVVSFKNYLIYANVYVDSVDYPSRFYWCNLKDIDTWDALDFIGVSEDDGQEITGIEVAGDKLVLFKENSIYNILFTGDPDIPFVMQESFSPVGCASGYAIKLAMDGLVFPANDGLYYYDGNFSRKFSQKVETIFTDDISWTCLENAVGAVYNKLNQYWISLTLLGKDVNSRILVCDFHNNAFSWYTGIDASYLTTILVNGEERLYSGDYDGKCHRQDFGINDNGVAIDAYYWTKWFDFGHPLLNKRVKHVTVYLADVGDYAVNVGYNYDFNDGVWRSRDITMYTEGTSLVGTAIVGIAEAGSSGGIIERVDITGQGKIWRLKFSNSGLNESFNIRGFTVMGEIMGYR